MAHSSGDVVAFELSSTNGFFDATAEREEAGLEVCGGGGGDADSLSCDNNNNELDKQELSDGSVEMSKRLEENAEELCNGQRLNGVEPMPRSPGDATTDINNTTTIAAHSFKDHASGDQSIDSGVAGGDSDEADCGIGAAPSPPAIMQPVGSVAVLRPTSGGGGSSSSSSSLLGCGDEFKERSPLMLSPAEEMLQDQFFMNGIDKALSDDDEDGEQEEVEVAELSSVLGRSLEENSLLQNGKSFAQDCKICQ